MQPIIQSGLLFYPNSDKTKLLELEKETRRLKRVAFYERKTGSVFQLLHESEIYDMKQSFVYKMLELNNKIDEQGCQVDPLRCAKNEKKLNTIFLKGDSNQK